MPFLLLTFTRYAQITKSGEHKMMHVLLTESRLLRASFMHVMLPRNVRATDC